MEGVVCILNDMELIGMLMDNFMDVLEEMIKDEEFDYYEKDTLLFGVNVLKYLAYRCEVEGVDLGLRHEYNSIK